MDNQTIVSLGQIVQQAYNAGNLDGNEQVDGYTLVGERTSTLTGFNGVSFYDQSTNTLAIGIAGTNFQNPLDMIQNYGVAASGATAQYDDGVALTQDALKSLSKKGIDNPKIVFTGHSLGGISAQMLSQLDPNSKAVVFNSPGIMGIWGDLFGVPGASNPNSKYNTNVTYVYSEEWGVAAPIHAVGVRIPDSEIIYVKGTSGHELQPLIDGLSNELCFLAGTPISMWPVEAVGLTPDKDGKFDQAKVRAAIWKKPIEEIKTNDWVVSYDDDGLLIPGKVGQTFQNHSKHILDVPVPNLDEQGNADGTYNSRFCRKF